MIHLGFEVGTGRAVEIPLGHTAVTGQTQASGKTTTLEALVTRGMKTTPALAFVTKRGEGAFTTGRRVRPYFRDRADWQFVTSIIDATLQEKNKFLRPWIIRTCRTTKTLCEVQAAVRLALKTARGMNEGVYTQLDAYLELIVPEIERLELAPSLTVTTGLNVMDISASPTPMQMLLVQSALDQVNERAHGSVVIIPEAWEFIPEGKGSPVKASAVALVRKGAALGNYIWVDSQDMAGVDKTILRGCAVWLIGVQREANEIKRNLANIPASVKRPSAAAVAQLRRGEFYACWGEHCVKTYVQPAWMKAEGARQVALGKLDVEAARYGIATPVPPIATPWGRASTADELEAFRHHNRLMQATIDTVVHGLKGPKEDVVDQATAERITRENQELKGAVARLERELRELRPPAKPVRLPPMRRTGVTEAGTPVVAFDGLADDEARYQAFKARLLAELPKEAVLLKLIAQRPELTVEVERVQLTADGSTVKGRIIKLLANGFYDAGKTNSATRKELARTGPDANSGGISNVLSELVTLGFLTREAGDTYVAVPGMKVNVAEK